MHPVCLISTALDRSDPDYPELPHSAEPGVCAVTGMECQTYPRKGLFGKSFTDGETLSSPSSDRVGVDAWVALKYKWERMSSWICDGSTFVRLDRQGVRDAVLSDPPHRPWSAYATTSYKKHGALRAPINSGGRKVWLFESRTVDCSNGSVLFEWWENLNEVLRLGFGRTIIETLDCPQYIMRTVGLKEWLEFERWARPLHKSSLYAFLCYLLPSQEELKNEKKREKPAEQITQDQQQKDLFASG